MVASPRSPCDARSRRPPARSNFETGSRAINGVDGIGFSAALQMLIYEHDAEVAKLELELSKWRKAYNAQIVTQVQGERKSRAFGPRGLPGPPPDVSIAPAASGGEDRFISDMSGASPLRANSSERPGEEDESNTESPSSPRKTLEMIKGNSLESSCSTHFEKSAEQKEKYIFAIDTFMGAVILLNTVTIGVSADWYPDSLGWVILDAIFAAVFMAEVVAKLRLLGWRDYFLGPDSIANTFESVLVLLAIIETLFVCIQFGDDESGTGVMSLFRVLRLCRVIRIIRVMRLEIFKEVKAMIRGILGGMRRLLSSTVLIVIPVYSLCLVLRELLGQVEEGHGTEYFSSVWLSFFTVFRCIVLADCADEQGRPIFVHLTKDYGAAYAIMYCAVSVFMSFGVFNVIVALFVESVVESSKQQEKLTRRQRLRDKSFFGIKMTALLKEVFRVYEMETAPDSLELDGSSTAKTENDIFEQAAEMEITPEMFSKIRDIEAVQLLLDELDVADDDQHNLFETLDADGGGTIDLEELCSGIAKLRGDPCRSDIISINFKIQNVQFALQEFMSNVGRRLNNNLELIGRVHDLMEFGDVESREPAGSGEHR